MPKETFRSWWFDAILVAVVAIAALIASGGDGRIVPAALLIGLVFIGVRWLIRGGLERLFPVSTAEEIPDDVERARKALPKMLGIAAVVVVLVVGRIIWAISDGEGPSVGAWIYLLVPLIFVGYFVVLVARKAKG